MTKFISDLAKNIKKLRQDRNLTQDELSDMAGVAYSTIAKLEQGAIKSPSLTTTLAIAKAFAVDVEDLLKERPNNALVKQSTKIRFIYFDKNGVLVRFYHRAFTLLSHETHINVDKVENIFWHYNTAGNRGEITMKQFDEYVGRELKFEGFKWKNFYMKTAKPLETMKSFIEEIATKIDVGIMTNTFPGFVDYMIKKNMLPQVEYKAIVDSSAVGYVKPEPKIYEVAEKMAGYRGGDILFVDDSRANLMPATKMGWNVLWFDADRPDESIQRIREAVNL